MTTDGPTVERNNRRTRWFHMATYVVTLALLYTGWWLATGHEGQPSWLARLLSRPDTDIHRWLGYALVVLAAVAITLGARATRTFIVETLRVGRSDWRWFVRWPVGAVTGRFARHGGHFDPGQRIANVGFVVTLGTLVVTGVAMINLHGGETFATMVELHRYATYALVVLIVVHLVVAAGVLPGYRGVWRAMHRHGRVQLSTAQRVWPLSAQKAADAGNGTMNAVLPAGRSHARLSDGMSINVTTEKIRNVALVGHQGNGKTTLAEAMLSAAGVINRIGRVEDGNTVLDNDPEERARCQSLSLGLASFAWGDHWINLIDTPGYADFAGDAHAALDVADLAVFVVDAVSGPQVHDDIMWSAAAERSMPRMIYVNKMDRSRASYDRTLEQLRTHFGPGVEPTELPIGEEEQFHGVAELLTEHAFLYDSGKPVETDELPAETAEREHAEHEHLVEDVVELADDLLNKYLEGEPISVAELEAALHDGVDAGTVWPVLVGSALTGIGVDRLLEFICHVGPAPNDLSGVDVEAAGQVVRVACDPSGQPLAHVFKTLTDDYVGQLSLFKVLSGSIKADATMLNPRTGKSERMHSLLHVVGSDHTGVSEVVAGEIAAAIKLNDVATGDTLAPSGSPVKVPTVDHSDPVYGVAVSAVAKADEDKLAVALQKLVHEDPTLRVRHDKETHQTVLRGAGDAHVQVTLARLTNRYGVSVQTEPLRVAYRETLAKPVDTEGRHKKQSGGRGQFGVASVRFEPLPEGEGYEFVDKVTGGAIPRNLIPAVGKGIHESMQRGGPHGFPVVDLRATVYDGKFHAVDSDEMSFKMAGALALRAAFEQVGTAVLEPVSRIEITAPSDLQGDVMADLSSRRGQIETTEQNANGDVTVIAVVPTSETIDYAVALRSMTHGRGRFHSEVSHYQVLTGPLPKEVTEHAAR